MVHVSERLKEIEPRRGLGDGHTDREDRAFGGGHSLFPRMVTRDNRLKRAWDVGATNPNGTRIPLPISFHQGVARRGGLKPRQQRGKVRLPGAQPDPNQAGISVGLAHGGVLPVAHEPRTHQGVREDREGAGEKQ